MNGPQHYAEAERLLEEASHHLADPAGPFYVAAAKVHATLALAAVTAFPPMDFAGTSGSGGWPSIYKQWADVALMPSVPAPAEVSS